MERIRACIRMTFPDCAEAALTADTQLREIEGWDSMTGVNLLLELETAFGVSLNGTFLDDKQTLRDVVALLRDRGAAVDADESNRSADAGLRRAS